ncbi:Cyclase/dehydrase [Candidatus Nitrospira nitrificans]|uniref:Cyclase/dehydrase n=2 Tax=Candidatus Nitrospira nitrificans TaxID=1742973 RepID=A0A0S4LSG5_9BACT|nr:Cyclase/dehydrase [Candidatus Nitrospira nitrificans]
MKSGHMKHQQPLKSERGSEQATAVEHDSGDGRTSRHVPRRSDVSGARNFTQEEQWAYGLGWFGIGLGLAEMTAPRRLARIIGAPPGHEGLIRTMGLREITSGMAIVIQRKPTTAIWSRVAGDVLDFALLSAALTSRRSDRGRLVAATASVAGAMVMDLIVAQQLSRAVETRNGTTPITAALIIDRPRGELYSRWRDLSNLPQFMKHLVRIEVTDDRLSHWVAKGPAGSTVEWDAEITEDRSNECIAWRSVDGSEVDHAGSVRFESAPGGRGTMVTVKLQYRPPLGTVGSAVAAWFGEDPSQTVKMDLRRFKQVMETGEVITTDGQPAGRPESTSWKYDRAVRR